jgi:phage replication O-like protein O
MSDESLQLEEGFARIARGILKSLARKRLTSQEYGIILCVLDNLYGEKGGRKETRITYSQFADFTGIDRRHIYEIIKIVVDANIINIRREGREKLFYSYQKYYDKWGDIDTIRRVNKKRKGGEKLTPAQESPQKSTDTSAGVTLTRQQVSAALPAGVSATYKEEEINKSEKLALFGDFFEDIKNKWNESRNYMPSITTWNDTRKRRFKAFAKNKERFKRFWKAIPIADDLYQRGVKWLDFDHLIYTDRFGRWYIDNILQGKYDGLAEKPKEREDYQPICPGAISDKMKAWANDYFRQIGEEKWSRIDGFWDDLTEEQQNEHKNKSYDLLQKKWGIAPPSRIELFYAKIIAFKDNEQNQTNS